TDYASRPFPGLDRINEITREEIQRLFVLYSAYLLVEGGSGPGSFEGRLRSILSRERTSFGYVDKLLSCDVARAEGNEAQHLTSEWGGLLHESSLGTMIHGGRSGSNANTGALRVLLGQLEVWSNPARGRGIALSDLLHLFMMDEYRVSFGTHRLLRDLRAEVPTNGLPGVVF